MRYIEDVIDWIKGCKYPLTKRNFGKLSQQVLSSHDPDKPWHLHFLYKPWVIVCEDWRCKIEISLI